MQLEQAKKLKTYPMAWPNSGYTIQRNEQ